MMIPPTRRKALREHQKHAAAHHGRHVHRHIHGHKHEIDGETSEDIDPEEEDEEELDSEFLDSEDEEILKRRKIKVMIICI